MAIEAKYCRNHPERLAIGVCVELRTPICAECSTRYEGVNYSREGLRVMMERRDLEAGKTANSARFATAILALATPLLAYLVYLGYVTAFRALIDWAQWSE